MFVGSGLTGYIWVDLGNWGKRVVIFKEGLTWAVDRVGIGLGWALLGLVYYLRVLKVKKV